MKRHLPHLRLTPPPEYQRRCLTAWLREWAIDQALRQTPPSPDTPDFESSSAPPPARAIRPIVVGQIRLLCPVSAEPEASRPIYVALLVAMDDSSGLFLAAPFGRFSEPANPGEWRTGLRAMPLRILCLWNARALSRAVLSRSWPAGTLSPARIRQALDVYRHVRTGAPLQSVPKRRVGPPIVHPLDPRLTYEAEEAETFEYAVRGLQEPAVIRQTRAVYDAAPKTWLKAAEERDPYATRRRRRRRGPPPHLA